MPPDRLSLNAEDSCRIVDDTNAQLPRELFVNGHEFRPNDPAIVALFPDENTFRYVKQNNDAYIVFRVDRSLISGFQTIFVRARQPLHTYTCAQLRGWRDFFARREVLLKGLADHLLKNQTNYTVGESLIQAEAVAYGRMDEDYPVEDMKKRYREMLATAREQIKTAENARQAIRAIKEVLKSYGLSRYCRRNISFKDFINQRCANCQGQTMLFTALLLDLRIQTPEPWRLGIQIMKDHIRPVIYDGTDVLDLVYSTTEPDSKNPIYPLEFLLLLALKNHANILPTKYLAQFDSMELTKPLNRGLFEWLKEKYFGQKSESTAVIDGSSGLSLYDFSGIDGLTNFNPGEPPEFVTLDLSGDLENPQPRNKNQSSDDDNEKNKEENSRGYSLSYLCSDRVILRDILNPTELADVDAIQKRGYPTPGDLTKYAIESDAGWACPGSRFAKRMPGDVGYRRSVPISWDGKVYWVEQLLLPEPLITALRESPGSYKQKMNLVYTHFRNILLAELKMLKEDLSGPLELSFRRLSDSNNFPFLYDYFDLDMHIELATGENVTRDPVVNGLRSELRQSYFNFYQHALRSPDKIIQALNTARLEELNAASRIIYPALMGLFNYDEVPDALRETIDWESLSPLSSLGYLLIMHPNIRLTVTPLTDEERALFEMALKQMPTLNLYRMIRKFKYLDIPSQNSSWLSTNTALPARSIILMAVLHGLALPRRRRLLCLMTS